MATFDEIARQQELLAAHRQTLAGLLKQQALVGVVHAPPVVFNGIAAARAEIEQIKATLREWGADVDDRPGDIAPELSVSVSMPNGGVFGAYGAPGISPLGGRAAGPVGAQNRGANANYYYQHASPAAVDPAALADAEALLACLPDGDADAIPAPSPTLPPASRMKLSPNPLFVGREADLRALARVCKTRDAASPVVITTGIGGIGKTQLAAEFAHRYGRFFAGGVFWLSFADPDGVPAEIAACGGPGGMNLPSFGDLKLDDQLGRVGREWRGALPRLLIFDNCEDEALLAAWRPGSGGARVLVTSRRSEWDASLGVQPLSLDVLPRAQAIALLGKFRPDIPADDPDLNAVAAELGDLPLALHLAGSFLKLYRDAVRPADYLAELRGIPLLEHESLQGVDLRVSPTEHELSVARTFEVSYRQLRPGDGVDDLALILLARAACLAPGELIPRGLLAATVDANDPAAQRRAQRALNRLVDLGLLEQAVIGAVRLHRLLRQFVAAVSTDAAAQAAVEQVIVDTSYELLERGIPSGFAATQAHLRFLADLAIEREDLLASKLCNGMARYLRLMGTFADAQRYAERALAIDQARPEAGEAEIAADLDILASLLRAQGNYAAARPLFERALAIRERVQGPEHPETASSLNNLGELLHDQGDYPAVRPLFERALAIRERVQGPNHRDTAVSLSNLASILRTQGDYAAARPLFERALAICQSVLGHRHPDTASSLNNLAAQLHAQGDYGGAYDYYAQAVAICQDVLGERHPHTATSLNNMGGLLQAQGDYAGARGYYEQALAIRQEVLGERHPDTSTSLHNLGGLLQAQGDYAGARGYYEQGLIIDRDMLGIRHPETATSLNNLGELLQAQGDFVGARDHYEQALAIRREVLGERHPDTAASLHNLGVWLQAQGDYAGARGYYEQALAIYQEVLGEHHHNTATILNNLGELLRSQGDYAGARGYYEQALAIYQEVLGERHPDIAASLNNLGLLFQVQGKYADARDYYERALAICREVLGEHHRDMAQSLNNIGGLLQAQGDYTGARGYYDQALSIQREVFGERHPDIAASLNNLGLLLQMQGDYAGARGYHDQALAIQREVLGERHPDLAKSLDNLGALLQAQGQYARARSYFEEALEAQQATLGERHPDIAASLNNLGLLSQVEGNYADARQYLDRALAIQSDALGEHHPDTARAMCNLAMLFTYQQNYYDAARMTRSALVILEQSLGRGHPDTQIALQNLAAIETHIPAGLRTLPPGATRSLLGKPKTLKRPPYGNKHHRRKR